jgi:hypothetical protein
MQECSEDEQSLMGHEPPDGVLSERHLLDVSIETDELSTRVPQDDVAESPGVRRWLSILKRRKKQKQASKKPYSPRLRVAEAQVASSSPTKRQSSRHKPSDSQGSSMAFVTAVKSATATIASVSIATVSRRNTPWRRGHQRSSLVSGSDPRPSIDSQRSVVDEAARQRSRKRRAKLEELVRSEESYLADIRALAKVSRRS